MLMESDPISKLILGAGILLLCIIIFDGIPECVVHELYDDSGVIKAIS